MIIAVIIIQICVRDFSEDHLPSQMKSCLLVRWEKSQASSLSAAAPKEGKGAAVADRKTRLFLTVGWRVLKQTLVVAEPNAYIILDSEPAFSFLLFFLKSKARQQQLVLTSTYSHFQPKSNK